MTQEALKLALDALKWCHGGEPCGTAEAIAVVEKALAQEQEPVAWMRQDGQKVTTASDRHNYPDYETRYSIPLYTTPPQRQWVGLEGEEIRNLWEEATKPDRSTMTMVTSFAKSIEAKLKQKNGYAEENNT